MIIELQRMQLYKQLNPNELTPLQLLNLENEIKHKNQKVSSDEYIDFRLWYSGLPSRQESFAEYISRRLSKFPGAKILEVGGGRTGRLSRLLSKKGFKMTCIDPCLEVTSNGDIIFLKEKFNYKNFDLSEYDYVIAQEPCDATEHVVRACTEQHIPFMISLCGVPHKLISGKTPKDLNEWYDYLLNIASGEIKLRYLDLDPFSQTPILKSNQF